MSQSGIGRIEIFEDFLGEEDPFAPASQTIKRSIGSLRVVGLGTADGDAGVTILEATPTLSGVGRLTASATGGDVTALVTAKCFDVALMGTLVLEVRVQFEDLLTSSCFIGFCDTNDVAETIPAEISTTTLSIAATSCVGFVFDGNATTVDGWYFAYNGGTTAATTVSADVDSGIVLVEDEWDILRVEIDNDATARWYINGVLKKTLEGACSTSTNLSAFVGVESEGGTAETMDVDYILIRANRDWTR